MGQPSSPIQPFSSIPAKRKHVDDETSSQPSNDEADSHIDPVLRSQGPTGPVSSGGTTEGTITGSQNLAQFAKRYATKNKLTTQQIEDTQRFSLVGCIPQIKLAY